jgi:hypothetical protein
MIDAKASTHLVCWPFIDYVSLIYVCIEWRAWQCRYVSFDETGVRAFGGWATYHPYQEKILLWGF